MRCTKEGLVHHRWTLNHSSIANLNTLELLHLQEPKPWVWQEKKKNILLYNVYCTEIPRGKAPEVG